MYSVTTFGNWLLCLPDRFSEMNNFISFNISLHTIFRPLNIIFWLTLMAHALWKNMLKLDVGILLQGLSKRKELLFELYTHMPTPVPPHEADDWCLALANGTWMVFHVNCRSNANLTLNPYAYALKLWSLDTHKFLPNQGASAAWFQSFE